MLLNSKGGFIRRRYVLPNGTVLYLPFEGPDNTTVILDAAFNKPITRHGNPRITTANSKVGGSSLDLRDGASAISFAQDDVDFSSAINPVWEVSCWFYSLTSDPTDIILTSYNLPSGRQSNCLILLNGQIGTDAFNTTYAFPNNQWVKWRVNRDITGTMRVYLNDVLTASLSVPLIESSTKNFIGGSPGDNNAGNQYFSGYIDDFLVVFG